MAGSPPADNPPGPASGTGDSTDPTDRTEHPGHPAGPDEVERGGLCRARVPGPAPRAAAVLPGVRRRRGACGAERGQRRAR
ncbi:hypothetical protein ADK60_39110 [Streptomyces sp. XY431]|nr:hypothetical protein ADK60_39110 [Streptomyces sp. XY431]